MPSIPQPEEVEKQVDRFYNYVLINSLTDEVFYVGKGHNKQRMTNHEWQARRGEQSYKCRTIRKIWRDGGEVIRKKVAEFEDEYDAFIYEWCLINLIYGRENLTNRTDGGDGVRGSAISTHPPSQIEKHRSAMKDLYASDPEWVERQRQITLQWHATEEGQAYLEQMRQKYADPEERAKLGEPNIGNTYHAKMHEGFRSPTGEIYQNIYNLAAFSREHGLSAAKMCHVSNGSRLSHQGWTRYPPLQREEPPPSYAKAGFRSPNGEIFEAAMVPNLAAFCREHGLDRVSMVALGNGGLHSHQGWTRYPEIKAERDYHGTYQGPALLSPDGCIYTPAEVDNLTAFCHMHGLQPSCMSLLSQGKRSAHKGWTRYDAALDQPRLF